MYTAAFKKKCKWPPISHLQSYRWQQLAGQRNAHLYGVALLLVGCARHRSLAYKNLQNFGQQESKPSFIQPARKQRHSSRWVFILTLTSSPHTDHCSQWQDLRYGMYKDRRESGVFWIVFIFISPLWRWPLQRPIYNSNSFCKVQWILCFLFAWDRTQNTPAQGGVVII